MGNKLAGNEYRKAGVSAKRIGTSSMVRTSVRIDWVGVLIELFLAVGSQAVRRPRPLHLRVTICARVTLPHREQGPGERGSRPPPRPTQERRRGEPKTKNP